MIHIKKFENSATSLHPSFSFCRKNAERIEKQQQQQQQQQRLKYHIINVSCLATTPTHKNARKNEKNLNVQM